MAGQMEVGARFESSLALWIAIWQRQLVAGRS